MTKQHALFIESNYFSAYKQIRNQFRPYKPLQIIDACFNYLHSPKKNKIDELKKWPWLVLLLIKWVLIDEQYTAPNKKDIDDKKFKKILDMMVELGSKVRMPSDYDHLMLFFRNMAFQQFLYQRGCNIANMARQSLLFGGVEDGHLFKRSLKELQV